MGDSDSGGSGQGSTGGGTEGRVPVAAPVESRAEKPGYAAIEVIDNLRKAHVTYSSQTTIKKEQPVKTTGVKIAVRWPLV